MEPVIIRDKTNCANEFFRILPADWQSEIVPVWNNYSANTLIYTLESGTNVLGGGMIFSTVSPDSQAYKDEAEYWYNKDYLYLAFIWISENERGKKLGSKWLQEICKNLPKQKFWLVIEDFGLLKFYQKNGFHLVKTLKLESGNEWLLVNYN
jgi:GNAT superfamily N-acetyltransferase